MLSSCLLYGIGIGTVSTGLYAVLTDDKNKEDKDKKMEYSIIFSIVLFVSIIILYISGGNNQSIVIKEGGVTKPSINNTPPF